MPQEISEQYWEEKIFPIVKKTFTKSPLERSSLQKIIETARQEKWPQALTAATVTITEGGAIADLCTFFFRQRFSRDFFETWYLMAPGRIALVADSLRGDFTKETIKNVSEKERQPIGENELDIVASFAREDIQIYLDDSTGFEFVDGLQTPNRLTFFDGMPTYSATARKLILLGGERYKKHFLDLNPLAKNG